MSAPDFDTEGADWPNRGASRFVRDRALRWHVQVVGRGPPLLLLHGTGAATHSWRGLAPLLADRFTLVMPDLPGHGFTELPDRAQMSLGGIARLVGGLVRRLGIEPVAVVGHSAGAAIGARMILDRRIAARGLMALNGALMPLPGGQRTVFPLVARLVAATPAVPWLLSLRAANRASVDRLMAQTGSRVPEANARDYAMLMRHSRHLEGALVMMSRWRLETLPLERLAVPVVLVAGGQDRMVPPEDAGRAAARIPDARVVPLAGLGHLAHEERPDLVAPLVEAMVAALDAHPPLVPA